MKPTQFRGVYFIPPDINGNPRYLVHFLLIAPNFPGALKIAKKIGGKKYTGKDFAGGITFQSYNLEKSLQELGYKEISKVEEIKRLVKKCTPEELQEIKQFVLNTYYNGKI